MAAPPPQGFPYDHLFKILIIGDAATGKSSMLLRFTDDSFDEHIQSTIGVDFKVKHLDVNGKRVKLTIWDTAGQERFRTLTSSYYRGAHGVCFVYDVTRPDTFENLDQWLKEVKLYAPNNGESVVKLLVGNKIDLERKIPREQAESWARSQGMLFLEASAKTKLGIRQCFMEVVQKILEDPELLATTVPGQKPKSIHILGHGAPLHPKTSLIGHREMCERVTISIGKFAGTNQLTFARSVDAIHRLERK